MQKYITIYYFYSKIYYLQDDIARSLWKLSSHNKGGYLNCNKTKQQEILWTLYLRQDQHRVGPEVESQSNEISCSFRVC